jgi:acetoin utilization deacetylase AcuC-like enzyme
MTVPELALFYHPDCLQHDTGEHPERPARLQTVVEVLDRAGITTSIPLTAPAPAEVDHISLVHNPDYVAEVERRSARGFGYFDADTVISPGSYRAALLATGGAVASVHAVLRGDARRAFSLARPPGHHARPTAGMGFCLFNSVAVAARDAQRRGGVGRVAIVDVDVHHGNGTDEMFAEDPSVLYVSTHQARWYPGTGRADDIGTGAGRGTTVNLPLPPGVRDEGYRQLFDQVVEPIVRRFRPDLLLVSAGYDAHWADPLAMMELSIAGYAYLAERFVALAEDICGGRLAFVLEGGYNLDALGGAVLATVQVLQQPQPPTGADQTWIDPLGPSPSRKPAPDLSAIVKAARIIHKLD